MKYNASRDVLVVETCIAMISGLSTSVSLQSVNLLIFLKKKEKISFYVT